MAKPQIALWHNLPSGGGKRALMEHVKRISQTVDVHLFTTSLVDDEFCPIEPYCVSVKTYTVLPHSASLGMNRISRRWEQGSQMFELSPIMASDIDEGNFAAVYVASCQIEHAPSFLRFLKTSSMYMCQEGLREYYEPRPALEGPKDMLGRTLKRPDLIRRMLRDKRAIRSAGKVAVNSRHTQNLIKKWYGIDSEICYPGVDPVTFFPAKTKVSDRKTFLSVGRLNRLKGHDFVIEVIGGLPKDYRFLTIAFDQDGEAERARLQAIADAHDVSLKFAFNIPVEELRQYYQTCWAVVCGQLREPFGLIPVEAMACGALVCAVAEGGFMETVEDGKNGVLVPRDAALASKALEKLVTNEKAAEAMRASALACVLEKWTWDVRCKWVLEFLLN